MRMIEPKNDAKVHGERVRGEAFQRRVSTAARDAIGTAPRSHHVKPTA